MRQADLAVWLAAAGLVTALSAITAYEHLAWNWHFAREVAPEDTAWHWLRAALTMALSLLAVGAVAAAGPAGSVVHGQTSAGALRLGWAVLGGSTLLTVLLAVSPSAYREFGAEDGIVEWGSAAALLLGSAFCVLWLLRLLKAGPPRNTLHVAAAAGFVVLFFVMAMEEISWGQRVLGFSTPPAIAEENWQHEFNLHNMHTDVAEYALYTGTGLFLVILPLVREKLGHWRIVAPFAALMPDRTVALISAPMLAFTYARWDLLPMQSIFYGGLLACVVFAVGASRGARMREAILFATISGFLVVSEAVHLLLGHRMVEIFDETEYREAILAVGIAWFGWRQWRGAPA